MVRKRLSAGLLCQIGLDFFEFLKETDRASITDRLELREIYNAEFRSRYVLHHLTHLNVYGRTAALCFLCLF